MKEEISIILNGVRYDVAPRKEGSATPYCYDNCDLYKFCSKVEERTKEEWIGNKELKESFYMSDVCSGLLNTDKLYFRKVES
jgi:hypothetical protein